MAKNNEKSEVCVVGLGYSAGGLEPVQKILSCVGDDTDMAFVVVQHLKEDQPSHLREILSKATRMPVQTIEQGERVRPGVVYVVPPAFDAAMSGEFLNLSKRSDRGGVHLGIDFFFTSLSQCRKTKAIGVVLSGTGSDGTLGLKAIKSEGGITIVQDPGTARFDGMPRSAIASGVADLILPPEAIAQELRRIAKHPYTVAALVPDPPGESLATEIGNAPAEYKPFRPILDLLLDQTRLDFSQYKMSTIRRRIERQMMLRKIETVEKYAEYLRKNTDEVKALYEDIFIHVTDFFRDPDAFEALRKKVFPSITHEKNKATPIRIWVPGCATGEEVYSLAIALSEYLDEHSLRIPINIFAGDISEPAVQVARKGVYAEYQMRNVSERRLERFFEKTKSGFKVKKEIRDACIFSRHDVTSNPPIPNVDLISCRNVLIYFSTELQRRIFPVFHYALKPDGFLWLGRAESPESTSKLFRAVDKAHKIFTRVSSTALSETTPRFSATSYSGAEAGLTKTMPGLPPGSNSADQVILFRYSPPSVVVDSGLEILQFRGRTVPYLEPPPGAASYNLLKMANPEILGALRQCVQTAKKQNSQVRKENVELEFEGKRRKIHIDVSPLNPTAPVKDRHLLVVFEDTASLKAAKAKAMPQRKTRRKGEDQLENLSQYNAQLLQELDAAREYQQSLIEEYETAQEELTSANEELRSTNEELQSTNEELHSSNEELGTAKEELQAANEELLSTNDELQKRNTELENALQQLENSERRFRLMVESVKDYAIFMLDSQGNVATWNEGAKRFKGYEANEIIGQHFSRFYTPEEKDWKPKMELEVASKVGRFEDTGWRLRKDGSRFWANVVITALRDMKGNLIGFGKVTRDLTERKLAEDEQRAASERFERLARTFDTALSSSPDFHYVIDKELRFTYANQALLKLLGKTLDEVTGKGFRELGFPADLAKVQESQLGEVLRGKTVRGEHTFTGSDGKTGYFEYIFIPIRDENGEVQSVSGTTRDVTERRALEEARLKQQRREVELDQLREREEEFRTLANSLPQMAWMAQPDGNITWYNRRWFEYTGTTQEEMEGWGWQSVHDPKLLPSVVEKWRKSIASGSPFEMEFPLRSADGTYRWFLTRAEPVKDAQGKVTRWFGTNTDIDEQRRAREENEVLASASAVFAESLDLDKTLKALADLLVSRFADWCSIWVADPIDEPRIAAVAHPDPDRLREVQELFRDYPPDPKAAIGPANVLRSGRSEHYPEISGQLLERAARDKRHLELIKGLGMRSAMSVPLAARGKVLGVITIINSGSRPPYDKADLRLAEELGRRAGAAVDNAILYRQAQDAVHIRDEFLSIASHELKTPLTSLQIQAQLRERNVAKGDAGAFSLEKLKKMFEADRKQLNRLTRLIDDMLDVTRIASKKMELQPEPTDLCAVVKDIVERLSGQFTAVGSEVELDTCAEAHGLFDRYRIEQVVVNLLTNALKYGRGRPVHIYLVRDDGHATLTVRDEGIGIAKRDQDRIFQQFERATNSSVATGLGLGLYIAKQIVEAHGGSIRVESELNQGTAFVVELPLKQ